MRLTSLEWGNIHVLIYMLADHRMDIPRVPFETEFAGELKLASRRSEDNAELRELLTQRPYYVTKLRNEMLRPAYGAKDMYFEQWASDETYRKVLYETEYRYVDATDTAEPPGQVSEWMILGVGLGVLGASAGLALLGRRRSRRKPEGEEEA
jgi:hypothetical protein